MGPFAAPLRLAAARVVHRRGTLALAAAGLAAAAASLAIVLAAGLGARDRAAERALEALPASDRALRASWFGVPGQGEAYEPLAAAARRALGDTPVATVLFRESTIAGRFVGLGAVDGLARAVEVVSGRLPRPCGPDRCEVVRVRGTGALPAAPGLRLVEVGRVRLRDDALFGDAIPLVEPAIAERTLRYHQPARAPVVLAEGVAELLAAPVLRTVYRSYGWVLPLAPGALEPWELETHARRIDRVRAALGAESLSFGVTGPTDELREIAADGRDAGRRLALVGGQAAALLLGFAALAAARLRREWDAARGRLRLAGARRWQAALALGAEALLVGAGGSALGWLLGSALVAALAPAAGLPAAALLEHSTFSATGLALAAGLAVAAAAVLAAGAALRPVRVGGRSPSPLDVAAVAAAALVVAGERSSGTLLLVVPGLAAFALAVALARLLPPALGALQAAVPPRAAALRLASVSLARAPGSAVVPAAFVAIALGLALFAALYRTTLDRGHARQAAFAVPADAVVRQDLRRLVPVSAEHAAQLRALGTVRETIRRSANVPGLGVTGVTVLGVEGSAVAPPRPVTPAGPRLPAGAHTLELRLGAARGLPVRLVALVERADGRAVDVVLGETEAGATLRAPLPPDARGGRLAALALRPPRLQERGADAGRAATGSVRLLELRAGGALVSGWSSWLGAGGARLAGATLSYTLTPQLDALVRPRQPTDGRPLAAIVTPRLAALADGGLLPLRIGGELVRARVESVVERVPGARGDVAVLDRGELATALAAARPGTGFTDELWLDARDEAAAERALAEPPFDVLAVDVRRAVERELRAEPTGRTALLLLAAAALVALALAVAGVVLGTLAELRDERGELADLEAQGLGPRALRRQLHLRALLVGFAGALGGVAIGLACAHFVVPFVELTAGSLQPEPPLALAADLRTIAAGALACAAAGTALALAATARSFRAPAPGAAR